MKRYLVISFLVVGLALGGVSSACAEGKISVGARAGLGNFDMADLNEEISESNDYIDFMVAFYEAFGYDATAEHLEAITSGLDIEGFVGYSITDKLAVRLIAGYLASKQSSGGWVATHAIGWEETVDLKLKATSYLAGVEPVMNFSFDRATVSVGAGLAYYLATLTVKESVEETGYEPFHVTSKYTGSKLGYHGFVEGKFALNERVSAGVSVGFRSTGVIDVEEDGTTEKLDFSGMFYGGCISFAV